MARILNCTLIMMRPSFLPVPFRPRGLLPLCAAVLAVALPACGRGPAVPAVSGPLADVVLRAAFGHDGAPEHAGRPILVDTASFQRLGHALEDGPFTLEDVLRQIRRPVVPVDARDVLDCPARRPCQVVDDGVYVEVWEARLQGDAAELVVGRVFNVRGLHTATETATHRLTLVRAGPGWRLTRLQRLPS